MNQIFSIVILVVGVALLILGINAHDSIASSAKEAITGTPTDRSMWYMILGIVGIIIGGLGSFFRRSRS